MGFRNIRGFPGGTMVKNPLANAGDTQDLGSIPGSGRSPGVENGNLPGKFHGQRRLMGYWPWGHQESDTTEQPNTHTNTPSFYT